MKKKKLRRTMVPGHEEWAGYESDLDVRDAHRMMFGKSNDDIQKYFGGYHSIRRADELLFMPRRAFQYYVFAFAQFMMSENAKSESDSASPFLGLLVAREKRDPSSVRQVYAQLAPIVAHVASHQEYFDADPDIYGQFTNLEDELRVLCAGGN